MQMQRLFRFGSHLGCRAKFSEKSAQTGMSSTQAAI
jgi:hypothetical protein